jgi:putative tryptophan/tyrosine transport system substrate-binding protein
MLVRQTNRRAFIAALGGAAAWSLAARAQQPERMRRIGMLTGIASDDSWTRARTGAFMQELHERGWIEGRNLRIDLRGGSGNATDTRKYAAELVALAPDAILAMGNISADFLLQVTRTVPIVFTVVIDPVGAGFVKTLSRPGGNITGFMMFEYSASGKWLELLKQVAPNVTRAGVIRDPAVAASIGQFAVIQSVAPSLGVEVSVIYGRDASDIEQSIAGFARLPNGGLVVAASPLAVFHRDLIVATAARYKLPAIYFERLYVSAGGLMSYGPALIDEHRDAARYVDRILRGEKPGDLPVQAPNRYELVINLKTAKALGLEIPASLITRADEVIE